MLNAASRPDPHAGPGQLTPWQGVNNHSLNHSLIRSSQVLRAATPPAVAAVRAPWGASSDVNLRAEPPLTGDNPSDQAYGLSDGRPVGPPSTVDHPSVDAPLITDTPPAPCPLKLPVGTN